MNEVDASRSGAAEEAPAFVHHEDEEQHGREGDDAEETNDVVECFEVDSGEINYEDDDLEDVVDTDGDDPVARMSEGSTPAGHREIPSAPTPPAIPTNSTPAVVPAPKAPPLTASVVGRTKAERHVLDAVASALGVDSVVLLIAASTLAAVVLYRVVFSRVLAAFHGGGGGGKHRRTVLLVGLPSSGKTVLLQQLQAADVNTGRPKRGATPIAETRTSMQPNVEQILDGQLTVVDYPGHRRLRAGLFPFLREAATLVVVVDAVTIHDDRHEGAFAVAELLLTLLPSPECYGVRRLLFVCTKRDDVTSYSAKAVRKLLEKAMAASLQSRHGDLARVDAVIDATGAVVGRRGKSSRHSGGGGGPSAGEKCHVLELSEDGTFDFEEQLGIPVLFVEVGCDVASGGRVEVGEKISIRSVVEFLTA